MFETFYCSQYYELKKTGRDPMKGRLNATLFSSAIILMMLIPVCALIDKFVPHHPVSRFFMHGMGRNFSGRFIGKMVALIGMAAIGGIFSLTYGSKAHYERLILEWEQLPEEVLKSTVKRSLIIFGIVFGAFLLIMIGMFA